MSLRPGNRGRGLLYTAMRAASRALAFEEAMANSTAIMGNLSQQMRLGMERTVRMWRWPRNSPRRRPPRRITSSSAVRRAAVDGALPQAASSQAGMFDLSLATDLATDAQSALGLTVDAAEPRQPDARDRRARESEHPGQCERAAIL